MSDFEEEVYGDACFGWVSVPSSLFRQSVNQIDVLFWIDSNLLLKTKTENPVLPLPGFPETNCLTGGKLLLRAPPFVQSSPISVLGSDDNRTGRIPPMSWGDHMCFALRFLVDGSKIPQNQASVEFGQLKLMIDYVLEDGADVGTYVTTVRLELPVCQDKSLPGPTVQPGLSEFIAKLEGRGAVIKRGPFERPTILNP